MTNQPRVLTEEEEREIQARAEKATDGPWAWTHIGEKTNGYCVGFAMNTALEPLSGYVADSDDLVDPILIGEHEASAVNYGDADFIAHARQDIPALLASHRLLREERDRLALRTWQECDLDEARERCDDLQAENQKLRAALEKITAIPNDPCAGEGDDIDFAVDIARAALKEGE